MFHGHILTVEAEGSEEAFADLITAIESIAPYLLDNVIVKSILNRDNSGESLGETVRLILPDASFDADNEGQAVLYTGLQIITSEENPSIPAGESQVIDWDYETSL